MNRPSATRPHSLSPSFLISFFLSSYIASRPKSIISFDFGSEPFRHIFLSHRPNRWFASASAVTVATGCETHADIRIWLSHPNVRNIAAFNENRMNNIIIFYGVAKKIRSSSSPVFMSSYVCVCVLCFVLYLIEKLCCIFLCVARSNVCFLLPFAIH